MGAHAVFLQNGFVPSLVRDALLHYEDSNQNTCSAVLTLLGLEAIWNSRIDHNIVRVGGKPAWTHFLRGFEYTSSVIADVDFDDLES